MVDSYRQEYWAEAVSEALCEVGKFDLLTSDDIKALGKSLAMAADCEGSAYGWDVASSNRSSEIEREKDTLKQQLRREQAMVTCRECNGHGRLRYNAGPWAVDTECSNCRGHGRHDPR